ncbi:Uncharacterized conserved protein, DUF4415 family [Halopseudomonas litoralis]|uniref:Uncharacterized conserved protein, DUF4415 family n=1 Tax=Halopseudomonas litoralis TaxID=797277 RepID=A0A1H1TDH4_9GAMM|nr:BrnA antitoxin family protein [Halopseudomonas litoralis]SDS58273.1 Uncharacterized conserved protein, DUF4415 family [Halopseudomonas litoralis]
MNRKPDPERLDADNPEWTADEVANAKSFSDLNTSLRKKLASRTRGPQKAPTKTQVSVRLSTEVLDYFKASGNGWQTRLDEALKEYVREHQ